jgi:hypothetical protein
MNRIDPLLSLTPLHFHGTFCFFAWFLGLLVAWYISAMAQLIQTPEK